MISAIRLAASLLCIGVPTLAQSMVPSLVASISATLDSSSSSFSTQIAWSQQMWDIVVVGSGPAGIIAASKFAADSANLSVLLLEAGGPSYSSVGGTSRPSWLNGTNISRVDCPGLYNSIFDTGSSPQSLLCNEAINGFGGCTVGGSSAINAGLYFAPPSQDWDSWGISSWSSGNISQSEASLRAIVGYGESITSSDGQYYIQSSYDAMSAWLSRAEYSEVDINGEPNSKTKVYGHTEFDYSGGQRAGPVATYLESFLGNGHRIALAQYANVTRVLRSGQKCTGVEVFQCNPNKPANCQLVNVSVSERSGQIVLAAGALLTPKILYFSGIGPNEILSRLSGAGQLLLSQTDWIINENVGTGLYDNPNTFLVMHSSDVQSYGFGYNGNGLGVVPTDLSDYSSHRSGPYACPGQTGVFWDTVQSSDGRNVWVQGTISSYGYSGYQCPGCFTLNIYGTAGIQSRGRVDLDNNWIPTPTDNTYYQANTTDAEDIAGYIFRLLQSLNSTNITCLNLPQNSTESEILQYITTSSPYARGQTNHWGGSTRIAETCDNGVVTPNSKVCGMTNLYICDGGVIPVPFTVNPQYGIMVAGEYVAQSILADRGDCCGCLGEPSAGCVNADSLDVPSTRTVAKPTAKSDGHRILSSGGILAVNLLVSSVAFF